MPDAGARLLEGAPIANEIRTAVAEDVVTFGLGQELERRLADHRHGDDGAADDAAGVA